MKRYLVGIAVILLLSVALFASSHEGEFIWYKVSGPGPYHVDMVTGHGKTCYVFSEQPGSSASTNSTSVLLWCESTPGK
jgi:hypothetical protein